MDRVAIVKVAGVSVTIHRLIEDSSAPASIPSSAAIIEFDDHGDAVSACVMMNQAALNLGHKLVRAIVGHEIGHAALGHTHHERLIVSEIEADYFSARHCGLKSMRAVLVALLDSFERCGLGDHPGADEVLIRLEYLDQYNAAFAEAVARS